jgi:hypothetical protein
MAEKRAETSPTMQWVGAAFFFTTYYYIDIELKSAMAKRTEQQST